MKKLYCEKHSRILIGKDRCVDCENEKYFNKIISKKKDIVYCYDGMCIQREILKRDASPWILDRVRVLKDKTYKLFFKKVGL